MMKLGFNEATCMRNSTLAQDVVLAERFGYDYIEIRLDMLQEWLQKHTLSELADILPSATLSPGATIRWKTLRFVIAKAGRRNGGSWLSPAMLAQWWGDCLVVVPTIRQGNFPPGNGERFSEASARDGGSGGRKPDAAGL